MTENACSKSSLDKLSPDEEIHKLKEENYILKGKLRGYATLADILREKKEECSKLQKMNEDLRKPSPDAGSFSQETGLQNQLNGLTLYKNPRDDKEQSVISENIDVSLKSAHSTTDSLEHNKTQKIDTTENNSWAEQMSGVAYPPNDIFQQIKTDKYPTQETSIILTNNNEDKTENTLSSQKAVPVIVNGDINPFNKDFVGVCRSTSTVVQIGSDTNSKSLNLIEFPPEHSNEPSSKGSAKFKVVTASSSQSSSIQIIKPSLSRQGSKSDTALSIHVSELVNGDLGTDGPSTKMKKMLEDILPDLTRIEKENETLKNDNLRIHTENSLLLKKLQQLELQINNVSPTESLSSQTQVVDWEYINKTDLPGKTTEIKLTQKTEDDKRLHKLEIQNKELLQANSRWEKMFKEMRLVQENRTRDHQKQLETLQEQLTKMKTEDEKRRHEFDHILLTTKNRLEDEEAAKEALHAQLNEFQESYQALQTEKRQLEESVNVINREQLAREAEISVLRQGMSGESMQALHHSSESELKTEIAVLREQLTLFQEDFDRERQDRAKAQSEKDDLQKQLGKFRTENNKLQEQNKRYLSQLQTAEVNVKEAIEESTRLNSTNIDLRNKIRVLESQARPSQFNPNISVGRQGSFPPLMVQPETDPYARPSPPYLFHTPLNTANFPTNRERYPSEQQPGAWNCDDCTYSNHPSRTVCEMCGKIRTEGSTVVPNSSSSPPLYRRGENGEQNDLTSD